MPAPLGKTPTKKMAKIEVFGLEDSQPTRAAIRFFRERRTVVRFVDLRKQPLTAADLRPLLDRLGSAGLLEAGEAGPAGGGASIPGGIGALATLIHADPRALRLPLVRYGSEVTSGRAEPTWTLWLARHGAARD